MTITSNFFYGNEVSDYGKENGYVDYRTLAKAFDAVLNNDIMGKTWGTLGEWEQVSGYAEEDENGYEYGHEDIYQFYIVSDSGAEILQEAGEVVFYNETLDMYLWGVTHYGTAWDNVLTNIKIEKE